MGVPNSKFKGESDYKISYLAKETEPVHVFHFRTFKFDYEEDFTGPEMLLTEVNQAFAFAT